MKRIRRSGFMNEAFFADVIYQVNMVPNFRVLLFHAVEPMI